MSLTSKQLAKTLIEYLEDVDEQEIPEIIRQFVMFLYEQQLLSGWREIEQQINTVWKEKYGASKVKIISAHALTKEVQKSFQLLIRGADVEETVDERLIGGAVIRIDDKRVDGSISGTLRRLKTTLASHN